MVSTKDKIYTTEEKIAQGVYLHQQLFIPCCLDYR